MTDLPIVIDVLTGAAVHSPHSHGEHYRTRNERDHPHPQGVIWSALHIVDGDFALVTSRGDS
ncbi:MAG: hypothetical protein AB8G14_19070 [Ilumatobacter sp.]